MVLNKTKQQVQTEVEAVQKTIGRLAEQQGQLENQLTRLNLVRQFQDHRVARHTPNWIVNGRNKLEANPNTN